MMSINNVSTQLFDLLVSRDFDPEMLDTSGKPAPDPSKAEIFSFDFRAESGKDYGTVVVMIGNDNNFEVYFGDNVGRTMEGADKNNWFAFLHQLKNFAVKNFMSFSPKNINRLRYSMQGQAAIKEGLFESWSGTKTQSWNGKQTEARLMIKHKKTIGEGDARFRYVESLFVETAEGERYKLPFTKLSGGRAMVEHVRNGGKPYDTRGNHIADIVNELNVLSRFKRANQGKIFEGDTAQLVEQTNAYYETAQKTLKSLSTRNGYSTYFESWNPAEITEEEVVIEGLKHLFVTQSIDTRIESALPLLAKIQQQGTAMKEANIFEAWANSLMEGTWQLPDTPEKQSELIELMSQEQPVGADATNITEQLYNLLGDDQLFDQLEELADRDANADARQVIFDRMQQLSSHPDVLKVIEQLNIDPTAEMNPPESTPADLNESRLMDDTGETLSHILDRFKYEVREFEQGGDLDEHLYDALFDYYLNSGDIPYGVAKARTGDPYEWVAQNLESHLRGGGIVGGNPDEDYGIERESVGDYADEYQDDLAGILKIAGVPAKERTAPDYETGVTDEGVLGTVGGAMGGGMLGTMLGGAVGGPLGAAAGHAIGTAAGAVGGQELTKGGSGIIEDDEETDEGWKGQLAGGTAGTIAGSLAGAATPIPGGALIGGALGGTAGQMIGDKLGGNDKEETDEGELGTAIGAGLGGAVGGIPGAALGGIAGHYLSKDDDKKQTKEGVRGALAGGALGGAATRSVKGAVAGAKLGSAIQDRYSKKDDSPLAGQYGHSGKMKPVSKDLSFLDRLKELSGLKK